MSAKKLLYGLIFVCSTVNQLVIAKKPDDGCGTLDLGPKTGLLSSKNYPGQYPNDSWCEWKIRVSSSLRIVLTFEDLSIEGQDCETDYLKVLKDSKHVYWQYCGGLQSQPKPYLWTSKPLYTGESELTVRFRASHQTSGFQLSYSTVDQTEMLTCSNKGLHFSLSKYRMYCPAGCGAEESAEVAGDISHGYRHTSVLCKAAVHAGVILDQFGGPITVEEEQGLQRYEPIQANGILSKSGSLSDSLFTFVTSDCIRQAVLHTASAGSSWLDRPEGPPVDWAPNITHPVSPTGIWAAEASSRLWLELDLGEKKRITGILTSGLSSSEFVKTYKILYKEKSRWRTYTQYNSSEDMIFEGNTDSLYQVRNTFHPAITARYIRVVPLQWHRGVGMEAKLLGCPVTRTSPGEQVNMSSLVPMATHPKTHPGEADITVPVHTQPDLVNMVILGVSIFAVVILVMTGVCVFKFHKKKNKENPYDSADKPQTGCWKHPSARHQSSEFTFSYSSEKDPLPKMDLVTSNMADYQQPLMLGAGTVSRKGSTFRPMDTDAKDDGNEVTSHYDYLHTANQYALPLTNQEPEYATPIIERHIFRKDGFLTDPSYSVPGVVLSKSPSFKARDNTNSRMEAEGLSGGYQTPHVKSERANHSEGVYDSPKVSRPAVVGIRDGSEYQKPQAKGPAQGSYSRSRDLVWPDLTTSCRPDPEGSSLGGS